MRLTHWLGKLYAAFGISSKRIPVVRIPVRARQRLARAASSVEPLEERLLLANVPGGDIANGTVWASGEVQRIMGDVRIPAGSTLTIQPGAIVKFNAFHLDFTVEGTLLAQGTSVSPIVFTELRDDTGGDTNGDGASSSPTNGNWGRIEFKAGSTGSVLDHVDVRYGGYDSTGEIFVNGGQLTLTNSVVRNSSTNGVRIQTSSPTLTGNTYLNNSGGAVSMDLASNPAISGVTVTNNFVNGLVLDAGTLVGNRQWNDPDIVYWFTNDITVPQGNTLTIGPGQVIKRPFFGDLFVNGSLAANGTVDDPIIFTEQRDDTAGGDTNNNFGGSGPANGNTGVIRFSNTSTANVLDRVEVRYGGYDNAASVTVDGAPLAFTNGVIRNSGTFGLRVQSSNPTVTNNSFTNNTSGAISMDLASNPAVSGNTLDNNGVNGLVLDTGTLAVNGVWNDPDIVYWFTNDITVPVGLSLTIVAGQVIKRPFFGDLFVNGSLMANGTGVAPIVFTEHRDDTARGDTNNNLDGSVPANGNSGVIRFSNTSTANVLDHVEVRYGGYDNVASVTVDGAPLTYTNGVIRNSGTFGLRIQSSNPTVTNNAFANNTNGAISMDLASNPAISGNTLDNNGVNGLVLDAGTLAVNGVWNDPDIVYWFSNDITVPVGLSLTIAAGQVIKRPFFGDLFVNGSLMANGTTEDPIIITEHRDDTAGGDTNNNLDGNGPGNGNAGVIRFSATSTANMLDHTEVRYGGYDNVASVIVDAAPLTYTNGVIRHSGTGGLRIQSSNPIVTGNTFENNFGAALAMDLASNPAVSGNTLSGNGINGLALDSGSLVVDGVWNDPDIVYWFTNDITVPQGKTLTIAPGQVIKRPFFGDLFVNGSLVANGISAAPIVFTEHRDDTAGGDSNNNGTGSVPNSGNSGRIQFSNTSSGNVMDYAEVRYAGFDSTAAILVDGTSLTFSNGVIRNTSTNALQVKTGATVDVRNSVIANNADAGLRAESGATVTAFNNTIDGNVRGATVDGTGTILELTNNLITHNSFVGIAVTNKGIFHASFNDVFNPNANLGNYNGTPNATGADGNLSADPKYVNRAAFDFHLQAISPAIDAGTSNDAPIDDRDFNFRTDTPAVANTGAGSSPFFDMGAYEFGGPPRAVKHSPSGNVADVVSKILFTFRGAMDTASFSPASDVISFTGPTGPLVVTGFQWLNKYQLEVTFNTQAKAGDYQLVIGPNILDADSNALDTDADGVRGESVEDRYSATWKIVPPRVVRQSPQDFVPAPLDHLDFTFDRPMDQQSFSLADIVSFTGPNGDLSATGFSWIDSRTLRVTFDSQTTLGSYEMVLGTDIADVGGNLLDQSRNGIAGEVPVDHYVAAFTLANIFHVSGNITQNTTWSGLIIVDANVTVQSGVTLTIAPGTIVKLNDLTTIFVQAGGTLLSNGTIAQPVRITSIHDDTIGGDSDQNDDRIAPQAGDWISLQIDGGTANLESTHVRYGGGSASGSWNQSGMIRTTGSATLNISRSVLSDAFFDGVLAQSGTTTITNSIVTGADRGVVSWLGGTQVIVTNCTFVDNRVGLLGHGGTLNVVNSIVSHNLQFGIDNDIDPDPTVSFTDIFTPGGTNTRGFANPIGSNSNVSVDPQFINAESGNYRLDFGSPAIDAANGTAAPTTDHVGSPRYDDPRTANTGTMTANSAFADMGALEFVEGAPSDLDLIVTAVGGPTTGLQGDTITVQWTTKNIGTAVAGGTWHDAVYLSADPVWTADDILLGDALHNGDLGPNHSYENSAEVKIPGVLPGAYYFLVRANSDDALFEGMNRTNNARESASAVALDVPTLTIGSPLTGQLTQAGDALVYKLVAPLGSDVRVSLDGPDGTVNELYIKQGDVPTRQSFDTRGIVLDQPDQSAAIGNINGGTYYVLVYGVSVPEDGTFTLTATAPGFSIDSVFPATASNTGKVTLSIQGTQFDVNTQPRLIDSANQTVLPTEVFFTNSGQISATFDLSGRALGAANVQVVDSGNVIRTKVAALNVVAGMPGKLVTSITAPDRVRIGRDFIAYITYTNAGDTDLLAPIFRVLGSGQTSLSLTSDRTVTSNEIELIGVNPNGPAGILSPGTTGRIAIYCRTMTSGNNVLRVETVQFPTTPIDYAALESAMRPTNLSDAEWDPLFAQLQTQIGTSWMGYVQALSRDATSMTPAFGLNYSVADVFQVEVDKAREALGTSVSGTLFLRDTEHTLGGALVILANEATGEVFTAPSASDGQFRLSHVDVPGTYQVTVQGYLTTNFPTVTVSGADVTNVDVVVIPAATISGRVVASADGAPLPDVLVTAFASDDRSFVSTTDGEGNYTISLPPETYRVQAGEGQFVKQTIADLVVGSEQQLQHVNLALVTAGTITGKVNGPSGAVADATVTVYGADGLPVGSGAVTSATGDYTISGLPAGQFTVQASANGLAPARLTNVTIAPDTVLLNQNFTLTAAGIASGVLLAQADDTPIVAAVVVATIGGVDVAATNTEDDGTFTLPDLAPGNYAFTFFLPGFVDTTVNATIAANQTVDLGTVHLQTSGSIVGTVVQAAGSVPLGGLRVTVWSDDIPLSETFTDGNGEFTIANLEFGSYRVTVGAEGQSIIASTNATLSAGTPAATLNFIAPIVGSIAGTLLESDGVTPVPNAAVTLRNGTTVLTSAITGADGRYQFYVAATGTYNLQAAADGKVFVPQSNLVISAGTNLADRNLLAGTALVQGTIRDASTGQPVGGGFVHVSGPGMEGIRVVAADVSGTYQFAGPAGTQFQIVAFAGSLSYSISNVTLAAGTPSTRDFSLSAGSSLVGVVTDTASGNPVFGATIFARNQAGPEGGFITYTDEQGGYSLVGMQPGTYDVIVLDGDHQTFLSSGLAVSGSETTGDFSLAAQSIAVSGTVTDQAANPLPGAVVRATDAQGNTVAFADTGADGSYTLTQLPPGTFALTASANGSAEVSLPPITVASGNTVTGNDLALNPIAIRSELDPAVLGDVAPLGAFQFAAAEADERSFTDRLFHRIPPKRLSDEATLPDLPSGPQCVSVIVAHREVAGRIHARDTLFDAWRENYEAGKDIKSANAALIVAQGLKFAGDLAKIYLSFQKVFFEVTQAGRLAIGPGQVFLQDFLFPRISQMNTLLITGKKLVEKSMKALGSGEPSLPDAATLLDTVKFGRQLTNDLLKALVDKKNLKLFGKLSDRLGLITDILSTVKDAWDLGTFVADAMNDSDTIAGNTSLAKDLYIRASVDATFALEHYQWELAHCEEKDPKVNSPDEVPLPGWAGGPGAGGSSTTVLGQSSFDPNDKFGPAGFDDPATPAINERFVQPGVMPFEVEFENSAALGGTIPAQEVVVTDTLDTNFDTDTVEFTGFGFGPYRFTVPAGLSQYQTTLDLRPDGIDLLVPVSLQFNPQTRILTATFQSLDPATGLPPDDPDAGFLPLNDANHIGEGFFTYNVQPKNGLASGTIIENQASIVFDINAPILTPTTHHTLDVGDPTSTVTSLPALSSASFLVNWSGSDDTGGSGVGSYDVYVSDNNGEYTLWQSATPATSATYVGEPGHTYRFYSVAHDNVGHVEADAVTADTQTTVEINTAPSIPSDQSFNVLGNAANGANVGTVTASDSDVTSPNNTKSFSISAGNATGAFTIDAATGQITVADSTALTALAGQTVTLGITVTDGGTPVLSATQNVSVMVADVNTPPVLATPGVAPTFVGKLKTPVKVFPTLSVTDANGETSLATIVISLTFGGKKKNLDLVTLPGLAALGTRTDAVVAGRLQITITLQQGATNVAVQTMLQGLTFQTKGAGLKILSRNFQLRVTDRTGLQSNLITQNVGVRKK